MAERARASAPNEAALARARGDFPALSSRTAGQPAGVYLDTASTAQKPRAVLDALSAAYVECCANVHRGAHRLSAEATRRYESARCTVARFLGAPSPDEIIFTAGATSGLNLVAQSWGRAHVKRGGEVLVSALEHHSNLVPWQMLCREVGAQLKVLPCDEQGVLQLSELEVALSPRTRVVAVGHASNALGTINDIATIARSAHAFGAIVVVDGAQSTPHIPVDVQALGCDFFAFSGHKTYGPNAVGALWGRGALLEAMPPWQGGGEMITTVGYQAAEYAAPPARFEAGTPPVPEAIALGAALDYLSDLGLDAIAAHEARLRAQLEAELKRQPHLRIIGPSANKLGITSFVVHGLHAHDVASLLDADGIAVRAGHHCAEPLLNRLGLDATVRISLGLYSTEEDVDRVVHSLSRLRSFSA